MKSQPSAFSAGANTHSLPTNNKDVPFVKTHTKIAAIAAGVIVVIATLLSIWIWAPVDLVPRWAAIGTPKGAFVAVSGTQEPNQPETFEEIVSEGFMATLVGMRLEDARAKVEALPGNQTLVVTTTNFFLHAPKDGSFIPTRLGAEVVLGRVIRVNVT